jgi:hypothetical protein
MVLRGQLDLAVPARDRSWDGTIGDARHSAIASDHNPDERGKVCAMDITNDPPHELHVALIAEAIRKSQDDRVKYMIFNHFMLRSYDKPGIPKWTWAPYTNASLPHDHHLHISVLAEKSEDSRDWKISQKIY